ncbi:MAG: sulfite exporter TauE/SafE family protein [Tepidibacter sp.]|jgi:uncharacterized membrane protein YfcA|uniref:sulfite exporter TauE/SafE family protein n=1 Tax=Tepidibacter sp. TaxID=2529387 RepID=UPI0026010AF7|nr:sulfite exporter TauE/SafE family protein [Tepidibacter sp.]MCT4509369.1 sulfite exporter TauE/SafE family protein [Tepidibacter sp.]
MAKILLGIMIASGIPFTFMLIKAYMERKAEGRLEEESFIKIGLIGALANFFDTLGLSSFAIETSLFKNFNLVSDEKLPGTLNVGATIPTLFQACIFIAAVKVDTLTLFSMIFAALAGAVIGAGLISKLPKKTIQLAMGIALFSMAIILLAGQLNLFPVGGKSLAEPFDGVKNGLVYKTMEIEETKEMSQASSLKISKVLKDNKVVKDGDVIKEMSETVSSEIKQILETSGIKIDENVVNLKIKEITQISEVKDGKVVKQMVTFKRMTGVPIGVVGTKLIIALIGNFVFGALNTLGIGLFAPCMTMVYLLGMAPIAAFPIMMGSCALLLPFAGMKFIKEDSHSAKASIGVSIMGPIGVVIAAYLVKSMNVSVLKWLLIFVVVYTTIMMFKSYNETSAKEEKKVA